MCARGGWPWGPTWWAGASSLNGKATPQQRSVGPPRRMALRTVGSMDANSDVCGAAACPCHPQQEVCNVGCRARSCVWAYSPTPGQRGALRKGGGRGCKAWAPGVQFRAFHEVPIRAFPPDAHGPCLWRVAQLSGVLGTMTAQEAAACTCYCPCNNSEHRYLVGSPTRVLRRASWLGVARVADQPHN